MERYNHTTDTITIMSGRDVTKSQSDSQIVIPSVICVTLVPLCFLILGIIMVAFVYKHYTHFLKWIEICREGKSGNVRMPTSEPTNLHSSTFTRSYPSDGNEDDPSDISTEVQIGSAISVSDYSPIELSSPHHFEQHHYSHPQRLHCNTPVSWSDSVEISTSWTLLKFVK